jgi:hypothetical protein
MRQMAPGRQLPPGPREIAVVCLFPDAAEVRYVSRLPARGQRIRSSKGRVYIVAQVLQSGERTFTAHCAAPEDIKSRRPNTPPRETAPRKGDLVRSEQRDGMHGRSHGLDDLAADLMRFVGVTLRTPGRLRHRYKTRNYLP